MTPYLRFLFLLFATSFTCAQAQTFHPDYLDGNLYLKVEDTSNVDLAPYLNNIPSVNALFALHNVDTIYQAFVTSDPILDKIYRLEFSDLNGTDLLANGLQALGFIEYAEKVPYVQTSGATSYIPNDLSANQYALVKINAEQAWDISRGDTNITVAVVDNAVSTVHEDLLGTLWNNPGEIAGDLIDNDLNGYVDDKHGYDVADLDPNPNPPANTQPGGAWSHGTHCAGIVTAETDNGKGIAAIGFNLRFIAVKASLNATGGNTLERAYEGVDYAISAGAKIISMSWGSGGNALTGQAVMDLAAARGVILIAAAGNDNTTDPLYPAAYASTISVGSTNSLDQKSGFSNYGSTIDVMAPGSSIYSTFASSPTDYGNLSGTSMSCPLVAGLAGLILSVNPTMTPQQVRDAIKNGCENIDVLNPNYVGQMGAGRINAFNSLSLLVSNDQPRPAGDIRVYPSPLGSDALLRIAGLEPQETYTFRVLGIDGRTLRQWSETGHASAATPVNDLAPGIYLMEVRHGAHRTTQKFMVR